MIINARRITEAAILPNKAHSTDAGLDLYAAEDIDIDPNKTVLVSTGIALEIPEGHAGLIWDRASMGVRGIHRFGGVIDSGYRGDAVVKLYNLTDKDYKVKAGDRIAQFVVYTNHTIVSEEGKTEKSERGAKGFGSSGK